MYLYQELHANYSPLIYVLYYTINKHPFKHAKSYLPLFYFVSSYLSMQSHWSRLKRRVQGFYGVRRIFVQFLANPVQRVRVSQIILIWLSVLAFAFEYMNSIFEYMNSILEPTLQMKVVKFI